MKSLLYFFVLLYSMALHAESFKAINPEQFLALQAQGVVVVDIRRAEEWQQTDVIKGSKLHTFFDKQHNFDLATTPVTF